jgi:hypothetical protein
VFRPCPHVLARVEFPYFHCVVYTENFGEDWRGLGDWGIGEWGSGELGIGGDWRGLEEGLKEGLKLKD